MNQTDTSARSASKSEVETVRAAARSGREYLSRAAPYLRRGVESGTITAIIGGTGLLSGIRALLAGEHERGLARVTLGAGFIAAALDQRRSRSRGEVPDVEQTDVVDTSPDVDAVADEAGSVGEEDHTIGETAVEVADTSPDVEDVGSGLESESDVEPASVGQREIVDTGLGSEDLSETTEREMRDTDGEEESSDETTDTDGEEESSDETTTEEDTDADDGTETADIDRLGEAAFDRQSREVPAPQRAFNQGYLAHSTEAFWGIRARDDAVLVSLDYDAIQGRDGMQYVASSEIGQDVRELPIPDAVLTHWDEVFGGGTAVIGGDDILFATTEDLASDGLLRILPAEWADDL
ncbi:hypothetical protein [Natronosalvus rutilus]|uniref:Uncharacterized protein n=1 Tax=Natronosalvus rutilus TaxID=2953753 RepID=A0A9E7SX74_9EURY|nr:hypothetical protein [Natronosalvus rutilus]UTF54746.1 hypothetical protein NGM29_05610 [Natronosalvus rutilus]